MHSQYVNCTSFSCYKSSCGFLCHVSERLSFKLLLTWAYETQLSLMDLEVEPCLQVNSGVICEVCSSLAFVFLSPPCHFAALTCWYFCGFHAALFLWSLYFIFWIPLILSGLNMPAPRWRCCWACSSAVEHCLTCARACFCFPTPSRVQGCYL